MRSIQPRIADEEDLWTRQAKKLGSEPGHRFGGCFFRGFWRMDDSGSGKNGSRRPCSDFHHFIMLLDEIEAGRDSDDSVFQNWHLLNGLIGILRFNLKLDVPPFRFIGTRSRFFSSLEKK